MRWFIRILAFAGLAVFVVGLAIHQRGGVSSLRNLGRSSPGTDTTAAAVAPGGGASIPPAVIEAGDEQEITEPVALEKFLLADRTGAGARQLGMEGETLTPLREQSNDTPKTSTSSNVPDETREDRAVGDSPQNIALTAANDPLLQIAQALQRGSGGALAARRLTAGRGPNLLLVVVEDLNREDLGAYGQSQLRTPGLDQLAAKGVRLTQFAGSASGRAFERTAIWYGDIATANREDVRKIARLAKPSLPESLSAAGYVTLFLGDCSWTVTEQSAAGEWNRWLGWNESGDGTFAAYPTSVPHDGGLIEIPENGEAATTRFDRVLAAGAARMLEETKGAAPVALVAAVKLGWWGESSETDTPPAANDWTDQERRHASAVTALDSWVSELQERMASASGKRGVAIVVVGLPRKKKAKGLERFRASVPTLDEGLPKAAWPYAPLIACWPGAIPSGQVVSHFGGCQDVLPTLLEMTGAPPRPPSGAGVSRWRAWTGDERD